MLFNSHEFIFAFLPVVFCGFFWLARRSHALAAAWLALASLMFYAMWNPRFVSLLLASITFNYAVARGIARAGSGAPIRKAKLLLIFAITSNLLLLGYFKYADFFIDTTNVLAGTSWPVGEVLLPLGISFFTFTQIAFLVDVHRGIAHEYNFVHYVLFVTYFPHLIAGPLLHHQQMMPQFRSAQTYRLDTRNVSVGLLLLTIGLFKKVVLADQCAAVADPIFSGVAAGGEPRLIEAWLGAIAYSLQLYFDFSAYCDMAIGLSKMFNVDLPLNFDSPYKSANIIEFWRRWHMTLSAFLKDYLYVPLGGNRQGTPRRFGNLLITMLLGGLWHGANWTFVVWGGLHGLYLCINHGWQALGRRLAMPSFPGMRIASTALTFVAVVIAWVLFRSETLSASHQMLTGMLGMRGIEDIIRGNPTELVEAKQLRWIPIGLFVVFALPNSQRVASSFQSGWRFSKWAGIVTGVAFVGLVMSFEASSPFIYFQV